MFIHIHTSIRNLWNRFISQKHIEKYTTQNTHIQYIASTPITLHKKIKDSYRKIISFTKYRDIPTQKTLWKFKYFNNAHMRSIYAQLLYDELIAHATESSTAHTTRTHYFITLEDTSHLLSTVFSKIILIHPPSSSFFRNEKKFDHMKEVLQHVDSIDGSFFTVCTHAVLPSQRNSVTLSQHTQSRDTRIQSAESKFILSPVFVAFIKEQYTSNIPHIYCIDDVATTGATLHSVSVHCEKELGILPTLFSISH